ncbi:MAG: AAA family ATPase [Marinilabiliaceae bacterium]
MNYSIDKSKLAPEDLRWLSNFEYDFLDKVQKLLNGKFASLAVTPDLAVVERKKGEPFLCFESNASFGITDSLALDLKIQGVLDALTKDYQPANATLRVKLSYRSKADGEAAPTAKKADDGLASFAPETPRYTFDQIIIPDETRKRIMDALSVVEHRELVYDTWGFAKCDKSPNSILSFYGPPGTGKTMCAHAIAAHLGKPLLAFNYADIESKYVGDAAKNLKKAFETATKLGAIMFFDEADSFLGKRISNVSQGAEQSINSQRSQMLIYLEEFKGVVIFATNLQSNVDKAFESRILAHIKLDLPSREARADIIKGLIPAGLPLAAPLTADDLLRAADAIEGLAGREIKQAVKALLFRKAAEDGDKAVFSADDFVEAMAAKKKEVDDLANEEAARKKAENEKKKQKIKESMQRNAQEKIEYLDGMAIEDLQAAIDRRPEVEARKKAEQEALDSQA